MPKLKKPAKNIKILFLCQAILKHFIAYLIK